MCMMKKLNFSILYFLLASVIQSCEYSVYIPDPIDPRLPKYTEVGNNVAGALINGVLWKSEVKRLTFGTTGEPQFSYYTASDSLVIRFSGETERSWIELFFIFKDPEITSINDWTKLDGRKIQFNGSEYLALVSEDFPNHCPTPTGGQIYFKNIDHEKPGSFSFSGTFAFEGLGDACENVSVTYGRFDYKAAGFAQFD